MKLRILVSAVSFMYISEENPDVDEEDFIDEFVTFFVAGKLMHSKTFIYAYWITICLKYILYCNNGLFKRTNNLRIRNKLLFSLLQPMI